MNNIKSIAVSNLKEGHVIITKRQGRNGYAVVMDVHYFSGGSVVNELDIVEIIPRNETQGNRLKALSTEEKQSLILPENETHWVFELEQKRATTDQVLPNASNQRVKIIGDLSNTLSFIALEKILDDIDNYPDEHVLRGPSSGNHIFDGLYAGGPVAGGGFDPEFDTPDPDTKKQPRKRRPGRKKGGMGANVGFSLDVKLKDAEAALGLSGNLVKALTSPTDNRLKPLTFVNEAIRLAKSDQAKFLRYLPKDGFQTDITLKEALEQDIIEMPILPSQLEGTKPDGSTPTLTEAFNLFKNPEDLPKKTVCAGMIIEDLRDAQEKFKAIAAPTADSFTFAKEELSAAYQLFVSRYLDNTEDPSLKINGRSIVTRSPDPSVRTAKLSH